jgi:hypothetical protein
MNARAAICALAACVGGLPIYPPIATANPAIHREVEVPMPARLSVRLDGGRLSVSFDLNSLRNVKIAAGQKMTLGLKYELRVHAEGSAQPLNASFGYASIQEPVTRASLAYLKSTQFFYPAQSGIPAPGERYIVEEELSLFETDVPPQHMWDPQAGKAYKVLWKKTLKS